MRRGGTFVEGALEATWLSLALCVPVFFNKYAESSFEPEKVFLLRSFVVLLAALWAITAVSRPATREPANPMERSRSRSVLRLVAAYALVFAVATLTSIDPRSSLWGSSERGMGTLTLAGCLLLFACLAKNLSSRQQVERLITVMVLSSVPISLYGIGQRFGIEPIFVTFREADASRVTSHLGNPVFLGAYLIMVIPMCIARLTENVYQLFKDRRFNVASLGRTALYATLSGLLVIGLYFTGSRGPMVALAAGGSAFALILLRCWKGRKATLGLCFSLLLAGLILAALASWAGPDASRFPALARMAATINPREGTGLTRTLQWQMAYRIAGAAEPLENGEWRDPLHRLRLLVGYGPETTKTLAHRYFPPDLIQPYGGVYIAPDRIHNDFWDGLLTIGIAGVVLRYLLLGVISLQVLAALGLHPNTTGLFWICYAGLGLGLGAMFGWWIDAGYFGLGVRLGSVAGLLFYICLSSSTRSSHEFPSSAQLTALGLLAGLIAHCTEVGFSFPVGATEAYYWMCAGILTCFSGSALSRTGPRSTAEPPRVVQAGWQREMAGAALGGMLMATSGFELLRKGSMTSAVDILVAATTTLPAQGDRRTWLVAMALGVIAVSFSAVWNAGYPPSSSGRRWSHSFLVVLTLTVIFGATFWVVFGFLLASTGSSIDQYRSLMILYYAFIGLSIVLLAAQLRTASKAAGHRGAVPVRRSARLLAAYALLPLALVLIYVWAVVPSFASMTAARARQFEERGEWESSAALYERALELQPGAAFRHVSLSKALVKLSAQTNDPARREAILDEADAVLSRGRRVEPLNPDFTAVSADTVLQRALGVTSVAEKSRLSRDALSLLAKALLLEPANFEIPNKMASIELALLNDTDGALTSVQQALGIFPDSHRAHALAGDVYSIKGSNAGEDVRRTDLLTRALEHYSRALELAPKESDYATGLARTYRLLGRQDEALKVERSREQADQDPDPPK